jgi:tetratricopeptide (TPR) repeat protein
MTPPTNQQFRLPLTVLEPLLFVLLPLAAALYGGVHLSSRIGLAFLAVFVGAGLALRSRYATGRTIGAVSALALGIAALPLIPVNAAIRSALTGDLAAPVEATAVLVGRTLRPLALVPWQGLLGWAEAVALVLLGVGVAGWATRAGRSRRLMWVATATGVAVVALMVGHNVFDLQSIYGTGVGEGNREKFFAPFVNPNHAGIFLAAIAPLAVTRAIDGRTSEQWLGAICVVILGFGVWASGSRGAVVSLLVGLAAVIAAGGGRGARLGTGLVLGVAALCSALIGPRRVLEILSDWVAPSVTEMVDAGYVGLTTGRFALLDAGLTVLAEAPLTGVGPAGFAPALRMVRDDVAFNTATHAHNEYLQGVLEHGVLVSALVTIAAVATVRHGLSALTMWSNRRDRCWLLAGWMGTVAAVAVSSLVDFPLRLHSHAILMVMAMGSLVGLARPHRGGRRLSPVARRSLMGGSAVAVLALGAVLHGGLGPWASPVASQRDGEAWMKSLSDKSDRGTVLDSAASHFELAVFRGLDRKSFQWLARVRALQGRYAEADRVLAAGTSIDPTMPWLWRDRARLAQRTGDADLARRAWASVLARDLPATVDPMDVMHEAFFGGEFVTPIDQARAILPERADRHRQAARVMDQLGLTEEAETLFRRALAMEPEGVNHYAASLMRWGRPHDAVMLLEANLNSCVAHRHYAEGLLQLRRYADAADAFQAALAECGARSWALRMGLCQSRLLSGDSRGEDVVEDLLEERPDAHGLRRAWLWVLSRRGRTVDGSRHLGMLKDLGVIRPEERKALDRATEGLPFKIREPRVAPLSVETVVP